MAVKVIYVQIGIFDLLKQFRQLGPPFVPAFARPTFAQVVASKGLTVTLLAERAGIAPLLLERISRGRQPLPTVLAPKIAAELGITAGEVIGLIGYVTDSQHPLNFVPVPPRPELGDEIPGVVMGQTQDVLLPTPPAPPPGVWVVGPGIAGASSGAAFINRLNSAIVSNVPMPSVSAPEVITADGQGMLWSFGTADIGAGFFAAKVDPVLGTLLLEATSPSFNAPWESVLEPSSGTLWVANTGATTVNAINLTTGAPTSSVTLTDGINDFNPRGMVAFGGFVYALGSRGGGVEGRIFKIDAVGATVASVSSGTNLLDARAIAYDGSTNLYVTAWDGLVHRVPAATLIAPAAWYDVVADAPNVQGLGAVTYAFNHVWISAREVAGPDLGFRLVKVTPGATLAASRMMTSIGVFNLGYHVSDGTFLWVSDPTTAMVHKLDPADIAASLTTTLIGGSPRGMVVTA